MTTTITRVGPYQVATTRLPAAYGGCTHETTIFGDDEARFHALEAAYPSEEEASNGHERAVAHLRATLAPRGAFLRRAAYQPGRSRGWRKTG